MFFFKGQSNRNQTLSDAHVHYTIPHAAPTNTCVDLQGNLYGTSAAAVQAVGSSGRVAILEGAPDKAARLQQLTGVPPIVIYLRPTSTAGVMQWGNCSDPAEAERVVKQAQQKEALLRHQVTHVVEVSSMDAACQEIANIVRAEATSAAWTRIEPSKWTMPALPELKTVPVKALGPIELHGGVETGQLPIVTVAPCLRQLQSGDLVLEINGASTAGKSIEDIKKSWNMNVPAQLTILRGDTVWAFLACWLKKLSIPNPSFKRATEIVRRGVYQNSTPFTTRAKRDGETDGKEYHFVSPAVFKMMRERGEFLEEGERNSVMYGTRDPCLPSFKRASPVFVAPCPNARPSSESVSHIVGSVGSVGSIDSDWLGGGRW
eukprot:m.271777 g.271777  ORF g.271777 m.271777 type:complete len:375 (-) comp19327_c0_seq4:71-1195(-)